LSYTSLDVLPSTIGRLQTLQELRLEGNALNRLPPEIGDLAELRELHVGKNKLAAIPAELAKATHLSYLNIAGNPIAEDTKALGELRTLLPKCKIEHEKSKWDLMMEELARKLEATNQP